MLVWSYYSFSFFPVSHIYLSIYYIGTVTQIPLVVWLQQQADTVVELLSTPIKLSWLLQLGEPRLSLPSCLWLLE